MEEKILTVGVVGLGLIGGSMARAYAAAGHTVYGCDLNKTAESYASLAGITKGSLDEGTLPLCDLVLVALYPEATVTYLKEKAKHVRKDAYVFDLCGIKKEICDVGFSLASEYGFTFVGCHPMAGTQYSGLKYSRSSLFRGAPMVIVPPRYDDIALLDRVKRLLAPAGFGSFSVTTAEHHDRMIAFTSQLAHLVSNAYVKSPTAEEHKGFSAGSYKDMTRVAWLNEAMWSELFVANREPLLFELDSIIASLSEYRDALSDGDTERLRALLRDGRVAKEKIDGK